MKFLFNNVNIISFKDRIMMLNVLQNEAAQLNNIRIEYIQDYCESLYKAKSNKMQASLNRVSYKI